MLTHLTDIQLLILLILQIYIIRKLTQVPISVLMGTWLRLESHFYSLQTWPEMTPDLTRLKEKDLWIFQKQLKVFILKYFFKWILLCIHPERKL